MKYFIGFIFLLAFSTIAFSQQFQIKDSKVKMLSVAEPLYVINGTVQPTLIRSKMDTTKWVSPIAEINEIAIEKIEILKNESAVLAYGDAGRNGVVKITMKEQ